MACTDFLQGRGGKKGTLASVLAPKRAVYHVLTSQGGNLVCFANQEGTLAHALARRGHFGMRFCSQEEIFACVLAPRSTL